MLKVQIMKNESSILRQRRLLEHLITFANEGKLQFIQGIVADLDGRPLVYLSPFVASALKTIPDDMLARIHTWTRTVFEGMATNPEDTIVRLGVAVNNAGLEMSMTFVYDGEGPGYFVPDPKTPGAFVLAIMMIAIMADDNGHSLLMRVAQCAQCGKFFLRKTSRPTSYCDLRCRTKHFNSLYTQSGKTKEWYQKRKGESE